MSDSIFRTITTESLPADATAPEIKPEIKGEVPNTSINPENNLVLESLGIEDSLSNLPDESKDNINLIEEFVSELMTQKKLKSTGEAFKSTLDSLMEDMDINPHSEPSAILDRIGGVIKGWKNIAFISDPADRRSLFMKLAKLPDSKSMNKVIFEEMNRREIYA